MPKEVPPSEHQQKYALGCFVYDYCVPASNRPGSHAFMGKLESLILQHGPESCLAKACQAVSMITHGYKLHRPKMVQSGEALHGEALWSFSKKMADASFSKSPLALTTSTVLGLLEVVSAKRGVPSCLDTHVRGIAAILRADGSLTVIFSKLRQVSTDKALFSIPPTCKSGHSLDDLLIDCGHLVLKTGENSDTFCPNSQDLYTLQIEAKNLDRRLASWEESRDQHFRPVTVTTITGSLETDDAAAVGHWPGHVDTYFDLYTAATWNIYRLVRCYAIQAIIGMSQSTDGSEHEGIEGLPRKFDRLLDDVFASIPYHLAEDVHVFINGLENNDAIGDPGKPIAGLSMMPILHAASQLTNTSVRKKKYAIDCLAWIGEHMGIGQSSIWAKVRFDSIKAHEKIAKLLSFQDNDSQDGCSFANIGILLAVGLTL